MRFTSLKFSIIPTCVLFLTASVSLSSCELVPSSGNALLATNPEAASSAEDVKAIRTPKLRSRILSFEGLEILKKSQEEEKGNSKPVLDLIDVADGKKQSERTTPSIASFQLGVLNDIQGNEDGTRYKKATKWYDQSARLGNKKAQFNLGCMYYEGIGVPQDDFKTREWWHKAADQGETNAQFNLGVIEYSIYKNNQKTYSWFSIAYSESHDEEAKSFRDFLKTELEKHPRQLEEAQNWTRDWYAKRL